jgi:hypothetical protein
MTPSTLSHLRALAEKATPGPWTSCGFAIQREDGRALAEVWLRNHPATQERADCDYIAAANPQVILALLDALEASEARLAGAEKVVEAARPYALHYTPQKGVLPDRLAECLDAYDAAFPKDSRADLGQQMGEGA